jgi:aconitate decarboxylase
MARPQIPSPEAIRAVHITAADVPSSDRPNLRSGLDGKFSLQYTAAAALLDGHVGLATFTDERLARADMQALLRKIEVRLSREIPSIYTAGRYLDLEVTLTGGETIRTRCERPRGSWGAPPITPQEHLAKARDALAAHLDPAAVAACIAACGEIESLDAQGVRALLRLASEGTSVNVADR